jgi:hypothetical protein
MERSRPTRGKTAQSPPSTRVARGFASLTIRRITCLGSIVNRSAPCLRTFGPGVAGQPHRHPGPTFGDVLEGEFELGPDDQPIKTLKAGETFYEPSGAGPCIGYLATPAPRPRPGCWP